MIQVLYSGRNLRLRRREAIENPPEGIVYKTEFPLENMLPDYKLTWNKGSNKIENILLKIISFLQIPNIKYFSKNMLEGINLLHTPGQLVLNNKPYIVEIDNVWCLAFYKLPILFGRFGKRIIMYFLKRKNCKKIVCISEAAKHSVINFFHDAIITKKCVVSYPFVTNKHLTVDQITLQKHPKLLYISSDFYLKGWRELIHAYIAVKENHPEISLTIITKIKNITEDDKRLLDTTDIILLEGNMTKESMIDTYMSHDLFICPTHKDSFGLVFLEAMSCGMAIIATDMFATKEMIINDYNWQLLQSPINVFKDNCTPNAKRRDADIPHFVIENPNYFHDFINILTDTIKQTITDPDKLLTYKKNSLKLFQEKFNNEIRAVWLKDIYLDSLK